MSKHRLVVLSIVVFLTVSLAQAQDQPTIECGDVYVLRPPSKPPLGIELLPQPDPAELVNSERVIGFAFSDGTPALIASTAAANCIGSVGGYEQVRFVGGVWLFEQPDAPTFRYVAVSIDPGVVLLLDDQLQIVEEIETSGESVEVAAGAPYVPPLDVSIRADSVCYIVQTDPQAFTFMRYCIPSLSARDLFADQYTAYVTDPLVTAAETLQIELETVNLEAAVSEIADFEHINSCAAGSTDYTCEADLIAAPFLEPTLNGDYYDLALLVVVHPLRFYGYTIQAGSYTLQVPADHDFQRLPEWTNEAALHLRGQSESGDPVEIDVPAVVAPFINEGDIGLIEILGVRVFFWCVFNECF